MRINKTVIAFVMSTVILSACSSTEEKDQGILEGTPNGNNNNDASTEGYQNGTGISGEQFGSNGTGIDPRFSDPANPLSKQIIYFIYNSSQVQQQFIHVIAAHSQYLVSHPSEHIVLEGHADERGSREYNIALGEQRAKAIVRMMEVQGVSSNQLEVVSFGEEKPASNGMDEAAWHLNRRVEIIYQGR
jgi:peptidoglycan-associated lipoprotein